VSRSNDTETIKVYKTRKAALMAETAKRVKEWEKNRVGKKPWLADVLEEKLKAKK
jgi:hypothetical protein